MDRFNRREFWEAHESWETLWLASQSEIREYLQGLIQVAAAYHHVKRGTYRGAVRLFDSALRRLSAFPPDCCGVDRRAVEASAPLHRARFAVADAEPLREEEYPELILLSTGAIAPAVVQW